MNKIDFKIILQNFFFKMSSSCVKHKEKFPLIDLSINVNGNFLKAALNDDLNYTLDYDKLLSKIRTIFNEPIICEDEKSLTLIKNVVEKNHIITGGYIDVNIMCEGSFYRRISLLNSHS